MAKTAIKCSKMFDPNTGTVLENVVIFTEGERVTEVLPAAAANTEGCEVIDLTGKFVTPGLCDCHMHLSGNGEGSSLAVKPYVTVGKGTLKAVNNVQADLRAGFTSVRSCGDDGFLDVALRNAINRGEFMGPRLMVCGIPLSSTGGHADSHYNPYIEESGVLSGFACDGPDAMRKAVRENIKHGVDFIKFMGTGGVMSPGTTVGAQQMTLAEMSAICETAAMYGMITAVHAHGTDGINDAIRAGVTSVEHGMLMNEEGVELMLKHGTTLVPTLIAAERIVVMGEKAGSPAWMIDKAKQVLDHATMNFARCVKAGVPVAFGTDSATPWNFHGKQTYEFELMCRHGMTPAQALTSATKTAAQLMRKWGDIGSIEAGKYADVVAFDGDPMSDITAMHNCCFVMKGGQVVVSC